MSNILYIVTLNSGNFSLPITQYHQVDDDTLNTKSPFEDNEDVVIVPMLEDKLYVYPLKVWLQLKNESSDALQNITGLDNLMIEYPAQTVRSQTIQLDETHLKHLENPQRLWFTAHKNHVEVWAVKPSDNKRIAQQKTERYLNKFNSNQISDAISSLVDVVKERQLALDSLQNLVQNETVERAIKLVAIGACIDFRIPKVKRKWIVQKVIREVFNRRLSISMQPNPRLFVYSIARNICVRYSGNANAQ